MSKNNYYNSGLIVMLLTVIYTSLLPQPASAVRILITTPQHGSHLLDKLILGETLVSRGHEVYLVVSDRHPKLAEISKRGVKPITYHMPPDLLVADSQEYHKIVTDNVFSGKDIFESSKMVLDLVYSDCTNMMSDEVFLQKVRDVKFDLAISEPFGMPPCYVILPVHLNIPYVSVCGFYIPLEIRIPALPSFFSVLEPYTLDNINQRTMLDKLKNYVWYFLIHNVQLFFPENSNYTLINKYAPQYSNWGELVRKAELYLNQVDHHLGNHYPSMPNLISVAGLTAMPAKPLPSDLEKIMQDSGEHGVILVTFGSSAYYMPESVVKIFFDAFSRINQTVIARFGISDGIDVPKNVKLLKWLPQTDILGHLKTKLFITHCGGNGQYEALYHAVPMIGFPMFADQHDNSERAEVKEISIGMNILNFTADELIRNIHEVIYTDKYRKNIKQMSDRWRDEKFGPRDRAAFWIEHVIKYGGRHLRSPAMELSVFELLMLDVMVVVISLIVLLAVCITCVGKVLYRRFLKKPLAVQTEASKVKTN